MTTTSPASYLTSVALASCYAIAPALELPPEAAKIPAHPVTASGPFKPAWESLEQYQVPAWFQDAKFGVFMHWGPQTLAGADGTADGSKTRNWEDYAKAFKGDRFDAKRWAEMFRRAGAKYVVQVVEHHDGYALYDATYTPWSSVKMAPKRDFAAELSAAVRKEGLVWGASSHTEEYWWFHDKPPRPAPPAPMPGRPTAPQPDKEFLDWWYARLGEIVEKYQPQVFWFDWCIEQPGYEPYLRQFAAYYYNRAAAWNQGVVLNYKYEAIPAKAAVLDISWNTSRFAWRPETVHPTVWQFDTMSNRTSWFWRPDMTIRPVAEIIAEMADVVSKNGNYLLNITPAPDGSSTTGQDQLLTGIGDWLKVNGEAIYGTRPWRVFGEGPTEGLGPKFQGNPPKAPYTGEDFRFTTKGDAIYAIGLAWPESRRATIKAMAAGSPGLPREMKAVRLLGSDVAPEWKRGPDGLTVELPAPPPGTTVYALEIR